MGKKGLKKKKKKKAGSKAGTNLLGDLGGIEVEITEKVDKFVNLHLKLVNWIFLDFELKDCNVEKVRLFTLKRKIKERHGRVNCLRVYMGTISPQSELTEDMATLQEMGVEGSPKGDGRPAFARRPEGYTGDMMLVAAYVQRVGRMRA